MHAGAGATEDLKGDSADSRIDDKGRTPCRDPEDMRLPATEGLQRLRPNDLRPPPINPVLVGVWDEMNVVRRSDAEAMEGLPQCNQEANNLYIECSLRRA
jgi:hypothetical protein